MATEKRLIDRNEIFPNGTFFVNAEDPMKSLDELIERIWSIPTVDAVEVPDKELLRAIKLLIKQYEHSKNSDYVHSPVAHALFHTWKQVDERRTDA